MPSPMCTGCSFCPQIQKGRHTSSFHLIFCCMLLWILCRRQVLNTFTETLIEKSYCTRNRTSFLTVTPWLCAPLKIVSSSITTSTIVGKFNLTPGTTVPLTSKCSVPGALVVRPTIPREWEGASPSAGRVALWGGLHLFGQGEQG